jgi:[acyl-carrier-protein] S-malonyltransferase
LTFSFVFPGQGSQSVGMLASLAEEADVVGETFAAASEVLGFDLWALIQSGPAETLGETVNTQPAMLAAGVATWRAWQHAGGPVPSMMAGHSLGEYSALVCSGALAFDEAVAIVRRRAELMQGAVAAGEGGMAAILGLDDEAVLDVCDRASEAGVAEAVNFNSPGQVVIAGALPAIEKATELAKEAGARRAMMLPVSVPAHSSLMRPAGDALAETLAEAGFSDPDLPVICAVDGTPYEGAEDIRERMTVQVYSPVRWVATVRHMIGQGVTSVIECGPGKVLAGLVRRIDRGTDASCIDSPETLDNIRSGIGT